MVKCTISTKTSSCSRYRYIKYTSEISNIINPTAHSWFIKNSAHSFLVGYKSDVRMHHIYIYYQIDATRLFMGTLHTIESTLYREWSRFNAVFIVSSAIKKFIIQHVRYIRMYWKLRQSICLAPKKKKKLFVYGTLPMSHITHTHNEWYILCARYVDCEFRLQHHAHVHCIYVLNAHLLRNAYIRTLNEHICSKRAIGIVLMVVLLRLYIYYI